MSQSARVHVGLLSPETARRPHFEFLKNLFPAKVAVTVDGLNLIRTSRYDLEGKADEIVEKALKFTRYYQLQGLIITSAPVGILNPGLESKVAAAVGIPVTTALSASVAALKAFGAKKLTLMTPFDAPMNERIKKHLLKNGIAVLSCPTFEDPTVGSGAKLSPEEIFRRAEKAFTDVNGADAFYFQGASLDPVPIIQRLEDRIHVPVIASNPAMFWHIFSLLDHKFSIPGYGNLLSAWPGMSK